MRVIFTILIFLCTQGVYSKMCPKMCFCQEYFNNSSQNKTFYYTSTSCKSYQVNFITELDKTTRTLKISNFGENDFKGFIDTLSFHVTNFSYLDELIITDTEISDYWKLNNTNKTQINKVRLLNLSNNKLTFIPLKLLSLFSDLKILDLSNNKIAMHDHQNAVSLFRTLSTTEMVNLSTNSLSSLADNTFDGLSNLKCLDLSKNELRILDNKIFVPLTSLQYLNLSNNKLEILSEDNFISLLRLQRLDISWNKLNRVASGSLQLPSLAHLILAGNLQLGVTGNAGVLIGNGQRLRIVDASRTGLKQVPAVLTHSIKILRLASNSIHRVSCGDLDSYPLLQLLDFTANELEMVEDDALGRLDSLSVLYFSDNKIKEIPRSLPEKLKVLHLEFNFIRRISKDDLQGTTSLKVLLLSDNNIRAVEEGAFSHLVDLVTLDLSRNPIIELQPGSLMGPLGLHVLRLASIALIPPAKEVSFPLSTVEHLITLDLSGSAGLAKQLMADTAALAGALELQELDLSNTSLEFIRNDLLHYLPQLRILHLRENRLNCSGMQWLAEWIRHQEDLEYQTIQCANPPELRGTMLVNLQDTNVMNNTLRLEAIERKKGDINYRIKNNIALQNYSLTKTKKSYETKNMKKINNHSIILENKNILNNNNVNVKYLDTAVKLNEQENKPYEIFFIPPSTNIAFPTPASNVATLTQPTFVPNFVKDVATSQATQTTRSQRKLNKFIQITNSDSKASNELSNNLGKLFIAPMEYTKHSNRLKEFTGPAALTLKTVEASAAAIDEKMAVNSSHWNITSLEMSMFTNSNHNTTSFLHPSMLILTVLILGAGAALAMLAAQFTRIRRRRNSQLFEENIEVASLSSVTELW